MRCYSIGLVQTFVTSCVKGRHKAMNCLSECKLERSIDVKGGFI